jgi:MOSC domain-containing protein YiiM
MKILSVNIGHQRTQQKGNELEITGIYKMPTVEPVQISSLGIREDFIYDQRFHGGPDQAIYLYGEPDYAWWSKELGRDLAAGTFGENLTLSEFESARYSVGDRLQIGSAVLEFTAPRTPCSTLARRMGDPMFVKRYRRAERPGMYCRVIREGIVRMGEPVNFIPYEAEGVPALEIFRDHYRRDRDAETLRLFLKAPVAMRTRAEVERNLQKLLAQS